VNSNIRWYIVRTFLNVMMYPQYDSNKNKYKQEERAIWLNFRGVSLWWPGSVACGPVEGHMMAGKLWTLLTHGGVKAKTEKGMGSQCPLKDISSVIQLSSTGSYLLKCPLPPCRYA
jgi:hypothetical protein